MLRAGQDCYKRDFDKRLRTPTPQYSVGDQVLIEPETSLRVDEKTDRDRVNNKSAPRTEGPFAVVALDKHTVTILKTTGLKDCVWRDRIVKAPPLRTELSDPTSPEVTITVEENAEPTPATGTKVNASNSFPIGVAPSPREDDSG